MSKRGRGRCDCCGDCVKPEAWPDILTTIYGADPEASVTPLEVRCVSPVLVPLPTAVAGVSAGAVPPYLGESFGVVPLNLGPLLPDDGPASETEGGWPVPVPTEGQSRCWIRRIHLSSGDPGLSFAWSADDGRLNQFYRMNLATGASQFWAPAPITVHSDLFAFPVGGDDGHYVQKAACGEHAVILQDTQSTNRTAYYLNLDPATRASTTDQWVRDDDKQWSQANLADTSPAAADRNWFATACMNDAPKTLTYNPANGRIYRVNWKSITPNPGSSPSSGLRWDDDSDEIEALLATIGGAGNWNLWCYHRYAGGREVFLLEPSSGGGNYSATHYYDSQAGIVACEGSDRPSWIHVGPDGEVVYGDRTFLRRLGDNGWIQEADPVFSPTVDRKNFNISSNCNGYVIHGFESRVPPSIQAREAWAIGAPVYQRPASSVDSAFINNNSIYRALENIATCWDWTYSRDGSVAMPHRTRLNDTTYTRSDGRIIVECNQYQPTLGPTTSTNESWFNGVSATIADHDGSMNPAVDWLGYGSVAAET